jgi:hypothetical protein
MTPQEQLTHPNYWMRRVAQDAQAAHAVPTRDPDLVWWTISIAAIIVLAAAMFLWKISYQGPESIGLNVVLFLGFTTAALAVWRNER